jgi:hypothetical protein
MMDDTPQLFLIDANSLITPHLSYYPFDFAGRFWTQLEHHINVGSIIILDMAKNEVERGDDELSEWMQRINIGHLIDHREPEIIRKYAEVLEHVQQNPCYKPSALAEWSKATVADPWLIATGAVFGYTIITFEAANPGLNPHYPSKEAKIPDVCSIFGVETKNLFYMIRQLGIII